MLWNYFEFVKLLTWLVQLKLLGVQTLHGIRWDGLVPLAYVDAGATLPQHWWLAVFIAWILTILRSDVKPMRTWWNPGGLLLMLVPIPMHEVSKLGGRLGWHHILRMLDSVILLAWLRLLSDLGWLVLALDGSTTPPSAVSFAISWILIWEFHFEKLFKLML